MTHFPAPRTRRGRWPRLRDVRIRTKLGLILITPMLAIAALAAARLADGAQRAQDAQTVRALAEVSAAASLVSNQVHLERIEAAAYLNAPGADISAFNARLNATDAAVAAYQAARVKLGEAPALVREPLARLDQDVNDLELTRQQVLGESPVPASAALLRYGVIMTNVLAFQEAIAEVASDPNLIDEIRAVAAMAKAKTLAAEAEARAMIALADAFFTEEELTEFIGTQTGQQEAFLEFGQTATLEQQAVVNSAVTGGNVIFADRAFAALMRSVGGELAISPTAAVTSLRGTATAMRWAEEQMQKMLLDSATDLGNAVFRQVLIESSAILAALILAITVTLLLARVLARSLSRLRRDALAVAERELPETVARLSDPNTLGERTPEELAAAVAQGSEDRGRDEIGQVAQAFTMVHQAAVRVAAEQAVLRTSVSAMFINLARRSQSLVDRMISQLDDIERDEADPQRLARMFVLDHLATRMRRNDENLLVLAGVDSSPPRTTDALVVDALRAAQSEVEQYSRIEFGLVDTDIAVAAHAVNDVVRLVAELFDNATRFSRPDTSVVCEARRVGDYMIIHIEDRGVGMAPEMVAHFNSRMLQPPEVEATTFRQMGLAVVARLASRYQIQVELRSQQGYGTIAYVMLPSSILILPRARHSRPDPGRSSALSLVESAPQIGGYGAGLPVASGSGVAAAASAGRHAAATAVAAQGAAAGQGAVAGPGAYAGQGAGAGQGAYAGPGAAAGQGAYAGQGAPAGHGASMADAMTDPYGFSFWSTPQNPGDGSGGQGAGGQGSGAQGAGSGGWSGQGGQGWHSAADAGWQAAAAAANPVPQGTTRAGLPKRVPQAQYVPGSVDTTVPAPRRSPESARGLLSSYQRGVQRGRQAGEQPH